MPEQRSRKFVIGDIHGCLTALDALLAALQLAAVDTVVTVGDYVDRGPDSRGVLDRLIGLADRCEFIPLLGNHEASFLAVLDGYMGADAWQEEMGGDATLASYGGELANVPAAHQVWLRHCRLYHEFDRWFVMHANYLSDVAIDRQPEDVQLWFSLREYVPPPHESGKIAIVGHTPQPEGKVLDLGHLKCIDTGCCYGGWLTALELESGDQYQANQAGETRLLRGAPPG